MHTDTHAPVDLTDAISALCPDGPPRVWSLIVTIFGDTGGEVEIGAAPLGRILGRAGVGGAAMRVALHRLKSDGWILARRVGRSSAYRLHPDRLAETQAASARIYAAHGPDSNAWHLALMPPGATPEPGRAEAIQVMPRLWLRPGRPESDGSNLALFPRGPAPEWLRETWVTPELARAYSELLSGLRTVAAMVKDTKLDDPAAIALRVLVVHAWRRVLLRHPDLPDALFGPDWPAGACRDLVQAILADLPRPSEAALSAL